MNGDVLYFTAVMIGPNGAERVSIEYDSQTLRQASEEGRLFCPYTDCGRSRLVYRSGDIRRTHFAHLNEAAIHGGESIEHFSAKIGIAQLVAQNNNSSYVKEEVWVDPLRPDILVEFSTEKIAMEIQRSPIDIEDVEEKIRCYSSQNIYTIYLFDVSSKKYGKRTHLADPMVRIPSELECFYHSLTGEVYYLLPGVTGGNINMSLPPPKPRVFRITYHKHNPKTKKWNRIKNWNEIHNFEFELFETDSLKFARLRR